jgi:hypothetical protein
MWGAGSSNPRQSDELRCVAAGSKRHAHVIADRDLRHLLECSMVQTLLAADSHHIPWIVMRRGVT